jgi:negative regulator of flagellin synthesis FlgM
MVRIMKITNVTPTTTTNTSAGRSESPKVEASKVAQRKVPAMDIQSSGLAKLLAQSSDVDMDKVNKIRQAISDGQLSLDPEKLAEAVLDMHRR